MLAHGMVLEQPERASALVLVDGALLTRTQRLDPQLLLFLTPLLGEWLYTRLRKDPQAAYATLRAYYANIDRLSQAERDFLFYRVNQRVWSDDQRRAYFSTLRNMVGSISRLQIGLPARLAQLHTPTLILWGEKDQINSPENGKALAQVQPGARLALIPEAGHMPHQEQAETVVREILSAF
jgi:pimeloyl-ACP methyl ester carboxylesterase